MSTLTEPTPANTGRAFARWLDNPKKRRGVWPENLSLLDLEEMAALSCRFLHPDVSALILARALGALLVHTEQAKSQHLRNAASTHRRCADDLDELEAKHQTRVAELETERDQWQAEARGAANAMAARVRELLEANNRDVERRREAERQVRDLDRQLDRTIDERDNANEWADKLAAAIAAHLGIDIGEHSNLNIPWLVALEAFDNVPSEVEARLATLERWVPRCVDAEAERDLLLVENARQAAELERLKAEHEPTGYVVSDLNEEQIASIREAFTRPDPLKRTAELATAPSLPLPLALGRLLLAGLDHPDKEVRQAAAVVPIARWEGSTPIVALPGDLPYLAVVSGEMREEDVNRIKEWWGTIRSDIEKGIQLTAAPCPTAQALRQAQPVEA